MTTAARIDELRRIQKINQMVEAQNMANHQTISGNVLGNIGTEKQIAQNNGEVTLAEISHSDKTKTSALVATLSNKMDKQLLVPGAFNLDIQARIFYGSGGAQADTGFFSWGFSCSIPLQANWARLNCRVLFPTNPNTTFPIGGFFSLNNSNRQFVPLINSIITNVGAAPNLAYSQAPDFCRAIDVMLQADGPVGPVPIGGIIAGTPFTVRLFQINNALVGQYDSPAGEPLRQIPIGNAALIQICNLDVIAHNFLTRFYLEL